MDIVNAISLTVVGLAFYFLPWLIAKGREHQNSLAIFWTNALLGWIGIGWIAALLWALTDNVKKEAA